MQEGSHVSDYSPVSKRGPRSVGLRAPQTRPGGTTPEITVSGVTIDDRPILEPPRMMHLDVIQAPSSMVIGLVTRAMSRERA
jgi:hypothetical protein